MTFRKSILLLIGLGMVAALVACSSNNNTPPTVITVSLSSVTGPLPVNSANAITATTNDPQGVTWSVTCASTTTSCGTFTSPETAGGNANTYNAPPSPTTNVVITATSVTNTSITASTSPAITINGATLADGTYVFSLAGEDVVSGYFNYYVAGTIVIAGGVITGGEQNFSDLLVDKFDGINPTGSGIAYTEADGNMLITLVTCTGTCTSNSAPDTSVGVGGTETITGTILPLSTTGKTLISEFDASASGSGQLAPQDPTAAAATPTQGYAFVLSGFDPAAPQEPEAVGGIINVDGAGTISGTGSIFDVNDGAVLSPPGGLTFTASTVSAPDAFGQVIFALEAPFFNTIRLAGYIVDSSHIQLVETNDAYGATLGGVAYSQGANTGTFTPATAAGTYVVGLNGFDGNGVFQAANQLTLAGGAVTSGFLDYNDIVVSSGTAPAPATSPDPVSATAYTVDAAGAGDVTISNITDASGTVSYNVQLYLDGNGHALSISMDPSTTTAAGDVLAGAGFAQGSGVTTTSFNGSYGVDVTGNDDTDEFQLDGVGPVSVASGAITGTVDLNWINGSGLTYAGTAVSGTVVTTGVGASNGVFTGTITGVDAVSCITVGTCTTDNFSYYLVDATGDNIAIETDINQLTLGFFLQQ